MPSWFRLFRVRSPLLTESLLFSLPRGTEMVHFPRFALPSYLFRRQYMSSAHVGSPIRKSTDQRMLAPHRSLSQLATSFIASKCQGIHRVPFSSLTIKFTHEQQISAPHLRSNFRSQIQSRRLLTLKKLSVTYLLLYCACTVKLALCVFFLSDFTSTISPCEVGQQSLFDFQRSFRSSDRNFRAQKYRSYRTY